MADGVRLAGARLAIGKQSTDTAAPGPGDKRLDEGIVEGVRRSVRAKSLVDLEVGRLREEVVSMPCRGVLHGISGKAATHLQSGQNRWASDGTLQLVGVQESGCVGTAEEALGEAGVQLRLEKRAKSGDDSDIGVGVLLIGLVDGSLLSRGNVETGDKVLVAFGVKGDVLLHRPGLGVGHDAGSGLP